MLNDKQMQAIKNAVSVQGNYECLYKKGKLMGIACGHEFCAQCELYANCVSKMKEEK